MRLGDPSAIEASMCVPAKFGVTENIWLSNFMTLEANQNVFYYDTYSEKEIQFT